MNAFPLYLSPSLLLAKYLIYHKNPVIKLQLARSEDESSVQTRDRKYEPTSRGSLRKPNRVKIFIPAALERVAR
jgi:hypothetical protein